MNGTGFAYDHRGPSGAGSALGVADSPRGGRELAGVGDIAHTASGITLISERPATAWARVVTVAELGEMTRMNVVVIDPISPEPAEVSTFTYCAPPGVSLALAACQSDPEVELEKLI